MISASVAKASLRALCLGVMLDAGQDAHADCASWPAQVRLIVDRRSNARATGTDRSPREGRC